MSFEGFYQRICASGHYFTSDAVSEMYGEGREECGCGAPTMVENLVNETNFCAGSPCQCGERDVIRDPSGLALAFGAVFDHPH